MSKIHLSEEQLQRYALDGFADPVAAEHVSDCIHCQTQISAYQTLYSHIREAEASLPDFNTELLIPDLLSEVNAPDKKEAWYLYSLLSGAIGLFVAGLIVYWNTISWIFSGIGTIGLVLSLVLLSGILAMQLIELYGTYRKKMKALNPE